MRALAWLGLRWLGVGMMAVACAYAGAQSAKPATGGGSVTGHVICGDTQRPARFAEVYLLRKMPSVDPMAGFAGQMGPKVMRQGQDAPKTTVAMQTRTSLDGSFMVQHVPAGDYYLMGSLTGYVLPVRHVTDVKEAGDMEKVLADAMLIHVGDGRMSTADITLKRGAVLMGRVMFEDGSPAVGVRVNVQPEDGMDGYLMGVIPMLDQMNRGSQMKMTDDNGAYRIAGMMPGKYVVQVMLAVEDSMRMVGDSHGFSGQGGGSQQIQVYVPGVFRRDKAKVIEVKADEVQTDLDVPLDLDATHTVRGSCAAALDRHVPNQVTVYLRDSEDKTLWRNAIVDEGTGNFHLNYVPEGTYTLTVQAVDEKVLESSDNGYRMPEVVRRYAPVKTAVIVGEHDLSLGEMLLSEAKKGAAGDEEVDGP